MGHNPCQGGGDGYSSLENILRGSGSICSDISGNVTMSLKAFHIFFVSISTLFAIGFGWWAIREYSVHHEMMSLIFGSASLVGAVALVIYGRWFLRKLKGVSYL